MFRAEEEPEGLNQTEQKVVGWIADSAELAVREHERRMHQFLPELDQPPQAVPFARHKIPDEGLARLVEIIESNEVEIEEAALFLSLPPSLAKRELARYYARLDHWNQQLATFRHRD